MGIAPSYLGAAAHRSCDSSAPQARWLRLARSRGRELRASQGGSEPARRNAADSMRPRAQDDL